MDLIFNIWASAIGLIVGSFLNCLVWRLHEEETIMGRSYCPHCRHTIAWYDNVPLLSFILLRGHCRHCHRKISWQYPLVELAVGLLFLLAFRRAAVLPNFSLVLARDWLLIAGLVVVFIYDLRWQLVPMLAVWPLLLAMAIFNLALGWPIIALAVSGSLGAGFFLVQYLLTGKRGLGEGDVWLGALIGLVFPDLSYLVLALLSAYFVGLIVSLVLLSSRQKAWKSRIALGPFLAIGAIITLIYGTEIMHWYLSRL